MRCADAGSGVTGSEEQLVLTVPDEAEMAEFGGEVARTLAPGDRVGLVGDLGAGKTALARAILRTLAGDPGYEVPSPTFTIVQDYPELTPPVRHVDLHRVGSGETGELGLGEGQAELVEWPHARLPITITIAFGPDEGARTLTVDAPARWLGTLERHRRATDFLRRAGWADAARAPINADASSRRYERLRRGSDRAILMDAPVFTPAPDTYARRARLADGNIGAFVAVGAALGAAGLCAPAVLACDLDPGFLLLDDLGDEKIAGAQIHVERYEAAMDALAAFHAAPPTLPLPGPPAYDPPRFDADLAAVEVALFPQWYLRAPQDEAFTALWREAIEALPREDDRLALRDVHSPNLMWLVEREGIARVGWIDYQDAMIAPSAYDVVSLAQDARIDVPEDVEAALVARYLAGRPGLDEAAFRRGYHVLGAERATRILGVFRRLNDRDGKPQYLAHLPRVRRALARNLAAEPSLAPLQGWFAANTDVMDGG